MKAKGVGAERLSHDPDHWESVRNDPQVHRKITARYAWEVLNQGEYALRHVYRINKPFLLMHGDADEITSHRASEEFVANTSDRTKLKIWEGLRHEVHNEFEYMEVFGYVLGWIEGLNLSVK
jgi:alpha-beta hydrolase superfamily lysophospholipase